MSASDSQRLSEKEQQNVAYKMYADVAYKMYADVAYKMLLTKWCLQNVNRLMTRRADVAYKMYACRGVTCTPLDAGGREWCTIHIVAKFEATAPADAREMSLRFHSLLRACPIHDLIPRRLLTRDLL